MALIWWEFALIAAIFAGIMSLTVLASVSFFRLRVQKWIGGAIGTFMLNLSKQAAEEEGSGSVSSTTSAGALSLGGFQITPELLQTGMQLLKMAQEMGFIKGGVLGGGGAGGSGL